MQVTRDSSPNPAEDEPGSEIESESSPIDENLRRVYSDLLDDDVPERFRSLLSRLREQERKGSE